ncbi:hypothetical protein APHMUC_1294 [Anaplasma phagocytophilum str. ApMUC09]|uniref:Uncharacterized protein n=1 Tax=Anaplasma phagocytophilum str. ApMUC09 TaxID=1359152 RepID=A0A0F3N7M7_ANAPH|nr:hypothetical protein APHMUC_1294 [Anaplasma phagocytophilum str. ApMUC09]
MPSISSVIFTVIFGIVLYVLLNKAIDWTLSRLRRRREDYSRKASPGASPITNSSRAAPRAAYELPKRFMSAYAQKDAPTRISTVESVSQVFQERGRSR